MAVGAREPLWVLAMWLWDARSTPRPCPLLSRGHPVPLLVPPAVPVGRAPRGAELPVPPRSPPGPPQVQPIQPAPAGVGASPAPVAKVSPSPVPITCSETPTVSQLVSSESLGALGEG